jgi:co-chaperonin GroES (HSP10)
MKGYRLLVKPKKIEHTSKAGLIVIVEGSAEDKLEKAGQQFGDVISIGPTCWNAEELGDPWCEVGDTILFSRHAGRFVYDPEDDEEYFVMNDTDVIATVEGFK